MATTNLGRVCIVPKGTWSNATAYTKLDVVTYQGSSYMAIQNNTNKQPTNTSYWLLLAQKGDTGNTGATGNGISSISKTGTSGLVDTYTITYTSGQTTTFTVTNGEKGDTGNGIVSIEKTSTSGYVDTYTITYTDGDTTTFDVTNGEVSQAQLDALDNKVEHYKKYSNALIKISDTDTEITLDDTAECPIDITLNPSSLEQVTTNGNQLVDFKTINKSRCEYTFFQDVLTTTCESGASYPQLYQNILSVLQRNEGKTLKFKYKSWNKSNNDFNCVVRISYKISGGSEQNTYLFQNGTSSTFEIPANLTQAQFQFMPHNGSSAPAGTITFNEPLLYVDSNDDYESFSNGYPSPSPDYSQTTHTITGNNEIDIESRNLKDFSTITYYASRATVTRKGYEYTVVGTNESYGRVQFGQYDLDVLNLKPNTTYTFSAKVKSTTNPDGSRAYVAKDYVNTGSQIWGSYAGVGEKTTVTFTTPSTMPVGSYDAYIGLYPGGTNNTAVFDEVQLELGSTASAFQPYQGSQTYSLTQGNVEYCKLGDYSDRIFKNVVGDPDYSNTRDDGKWYIKKNIGKLTLNGGENGWGKSGNTSLDRFTFTTSDYLSSNSSLCNYFKTGVQNNTNIGQWFNNVNAQLCFNYSSPGTTTLEQWKTWLSTHNLILYQPLATPTYTQLSSTLQTELDALEMALSYQDQTNITQTNDDLPFNITASGCYDLNKLLTRIETLEAEE